MNDKKKTNDNACRRQRSLLPCRVDAQLKDVGWNLTDSQSVRFEYQLPASTLAVVDR